MNIVVNSVDDTRDDEARRCVAAAGALLTGGAPKNFAELLFARTVPEDVIRYEPRELAQLAEGAWGWLAERKPGSVKMRLESPQGGGALDTVSIIEILNDDKPFLVDSVMGELTEQDVEVRLVAHPVIPVVRDPAGRLTGLAEKGARESLIHIHIERIDDEARRTEILAGLAHVLTDVHRAVADWRAMTARVAEVMADLKARPPRVLPREEVAEAIAFLEWLSDDNFTFLGVRHDAYDEASRVLTPQADTALGLLRDRDSGVMSAEGGERMRLPPAAVRLLAEPQALIINKANERSRVHRRATMDLIGVKRYDADGKLTGIFRIVGLFTSTAYTRSTSGIPYLRRKTTSVIARAGFERSSHSGKALANVLEHYPRDELFQIDEETLLRFGLLILQLDEHPRVRVLPWRDRFDRFVSVLVFVPRERYDSSIRAEIGDLLAEAYRGRVAAFSPFFPEGPLVRVHFIVARGEEPPPNPKRAELEGGVADIVRTWSDALSDALAEAHEPQRARALFERYRDAFSEGYREAFSPLDAVTDIRVIEGLSAERPLGVDFYQHVWDENRSVGLKVWSFGRPIPLSERVPVLEHMGFKVVDESTYQVNPAGRAAPDFWLHDMMLAYVRGGELEFGALRERLETAFIMVMRGQAENDGFNALVLTAGLPWRDIAVLRMLARYARQLRVPYSQSYLWETLVKRAGLAAQVVELFHARFDPRLDVTAEQRAEREAALVGEIEAALKEVESLDEDRI